MSMAVAMNWREGMGGGGRCPNSYGVDGAILEVFLYALAAACVVDGLPD